MVMFTLIFVLFGVLMWAATGVLLYFRRRQLRKIDLMRQLETTRASAVSDLASGTLIEVKGTLRCESPLKSEMTEQVCAYYLSQAIREYLERDYGDDNDVSTNRRRSEVIASNEQLAPFIIEDGWGTVGVRGEGAEIDALEVMNRFQKDPGEGAITLGGVTINLGGGEHTLGYRYVEKVLRVDEPVYVLGVVQEDGQLGGPPESDREKRFLISYRSEEQLEKKYRRDALWLGLIALACSSSGRSFWGSASQLPQGPSVSNRRSGCRPGLPRQAKKKRTGRTASFVERHGRTREPTAFLETTDLAFCRA
jgi:hypothetical protein